jgi:anti-sigma-K factor RskA
MSELNEMNCREFSDVAAELALGVLTGRERAAAIAHLDQCDACRENVRQLTMTGEGLLELLPSREPPAGFESRVMERIGLAAPAPAPEPRASWLGRLLHPGRRPGAQAAPAPRQPRTSRQAGWIRRPLAAAAVVVAVIAGGLAGWGLSAGTATPASTSLASATLQSVSHQTVGKVFLYQGSPRWLYMSVDMSSGNGTVLCQVVSQDGQVTTVGSFQLADGHGYWGSPATGASGRLTGARLVTTNGTVLATASFHSD